MRPYELAKKYGEKVTKKVLEWVCTGTFLLILFFLFLSLPTLFSIVLFFLFIFFLVISPFVFLFLVFSHYIKKLLKLRPKYEEI